MKEAAMAQKEKRPGITRRVFMRVGALVIAAVTILAHVLTNRFRTVLDGRFGRGEMAVTPLEGSEGWDSEYVKKETASLAEAKAASDVTSEQVTDEGIVLLKNDGVLPLAQGSAVVPFGYAYLNPSYSGNGAAASTDTTMVTPEVALSEYFEVNPASAEAMNAAEPSSPGAAEGTDPLDFSLSSAVGADQMLAANQILAYDPSIFAQVEGSFGNSTGIVFIKRVGSEGYDRRTEGYDDGTPHNLALSRMERETIKYAREVCGAVVLVLNSANPMELAPAMSGEYEADAIVWIGTTGSRGFESLAKILCGEVNPSGRLADIYPSDFTADPTFVNFGNFEYTNATTEDDTMAPLNIGTYNRHFVEYEEGIYVGYRYYETAAVEDPSFVYGTLDGKGAVAEPGAVAYPFGYGLSYTTFEQAISSFTETADEISLSVSVRNSGDVAGKDVVQIYYTSPYTDYDRENDVEKSATTLLDFAKTSLLEPGESTELSFAIRKEDMASYAMRHENSDGTVGCYVLEAGEYAIELKSNSHDVIDSATATVDETVFFEGDNARQSEKDAQSLLDDEGNPLGVTFDGSPFVAATNQFESLTSYMDLDDVTNLSREDWVGTQPTAIEGRAKEAPEIALGEFDWFDNFDYASDARLGNVEGSLVYSAEAPAGGMQNGLSLIDLRGVDYHDELWESLLDQVDWDGEKESIQQLLYQSAYTTVELRSVGKPATTDADGAMGWSFEGASSWASANLMASTWNTELMTEMGRRIGEEALQAGNTGWYAPACNTHRSPFCGRTYEYYSEDGVLGGKIATAAISGAGDKGVISYLKHFALNDQETNRNAQISTWATEQAVREIYLKPFEMAIKNSRSTVSYISDDQGTMSTKVMRGACALMSSYNLVGGVNSFAHYGLIHNVTRGEWGHCGSIITDLQLTEDPTHRDMAIRTSNDMYMAVGPFAEDYDSPTVRSLMRESVHHILYATANSNIMNGLTAGSTISYSPSPWQYLLYGATAVLVAADALLIAGIVRDSRKGKALADADDGDKARQAEKDPEPNK